MTPDATWSLCKRRHYSAGYASYWQEHPVCEACRMEPSAPCHHIRTRGAGGDDAPENLLALCTACHRKVDDLGRTLFCRLYPHLKRKVDDAFKRSKA